MSPTERRKERDRLRAGCESDFAELSEADDDEVTRPEIVDAAARAAAQTAHRLSRPDSDAPERQHWSQTPAGRSGIAALVAAGAGGLATGIIEALRAAGVLK